MTTASETKLDQILKEIDAVNYEIQNPYASKKEREKNTKRREELTKKAAKYGFPVPPLPQAPSPVTVASRNQYDTLEYAQPYPGVQTSNYVHPQPPENTSLYQRVKNTASSYNPFSSGKTRDDVLERQLMEQKLRLEREEAERKRQLAEETAAMEERIRQSAAASRRRNEETSYLTELEQRKDIAKFEKERELLERKRLEEERQERERSRLMENTLISERYRTEREQEERDARLRQEFSDRNSKEQHLSELSHEETRRKLQEQQELEDLQKSARRQELTDLNAKAAREREEQRRELKKLDEEVRRAREESREKFEEMARKIREQTELLMRMLEKARWNKTIERNWEIRLKALKSTGRRCDAAVGELRSQLAQAKFRDGNAQAIRRRMDQVKDELAEIIRVMDRETENLDKMYRFSGKPFVLDILNSLKVVSDVCKNFTNYLNSQSQGSFQRHEAEAVYETVEDFEHQIVKAYRGIPTLDQLKLKYFSEWQNVSESSGAITDGNDDGHVIIIEEID